MSSLFFHSSSVVVFNSSICIYRSYFIYIHVLPCLLQMEEDMEITPAGEDKASHQARAMVGGYGHDTRKEKVHDPSSRKKKKGLKSLVKSCVRGNLKTKD